MMWFEHKVDSELSQTIRRDLRIYRREKGKGGHKFSFKDLLAIYSSEGDNPEHAVVTHHEDAAWQHYWRHPERGWMLQKSYATRDDADAAVDVFTPPKDNFKTPPRHDNGEFRTEPKKTETHVIAGTEDRPNFLTSKSQSPWVREQMRGVFTRLGYETRVETVTV